METDDTGARAALAAAVLDAAHATRRSAAALDESGQRLEEVAKMLAGGAGFGMRRPKENVHRGRRFGVDPSVNLADTLRAFGDGIAKVADQVSKTIADR
jgi:hypothetical protein